MNHMKTNNLDPTGQGTSRCPADWWYQANTAGRAMSGVWDQVLLKPASHRVWVSPTGISTKRPSSMAAGRLDSIRFPPVVGMGASPFG